MNPKLQKIKEASMKTVFIICACVSIVAVLLICLFLFANGLPTIGKIGVGEFLLGRVWKPLENKFGILPMIIGSIYVIVLSVVAIIIKHSLSKNRKG